ncbi:hypothetical protein AAE478_002673 [Parahypoxylon ruwenzoriense]
MPISFNSPRPFSATSQVHPSYLPALHKSSRLEKKLITATVVAVGIGYGLAKYKESKTEQQQREQLSQGARAAVAARKQNEALQDAYGDRSNLAELEAAVVAYEARRKAT